MFTHTNIFGRLKIGARLFLFDLPETPNIYPRSAVTEAGVGKTGRRAGRNKVGAKVGIQPDLHISI